MSQASNPDAYALNVTAQGSNNVLVGGLLGNFQSQGGGNNQFVLEDSNLLGLGGQTIPSTLLTLGSQYTSDGTGDTVYFVGGGDGGQFGNVTINGTNNATGATLDFSNVQGSGIDLDMSQATTSGQQVTPANGSNLFLAVTGQNPITSIVGTPDGDTILGGGTTPVIEGAQAPPTDPPVPTGTPTGAPIQYVLLNFTSFTPTPLSTSETYHDGSGAYSDADQIAVLQLMRQIYASFSDDDSTVPGVSNIIQIYIDPNEPGADDPLLTPYELPADLPSNGNIVEVNFNDTPIFNTNLSDTGVSAVATATVSRGAVTGVSLTSGGSGYTSAPPITLAGGGGSGATAVATIAGGVVTGIILLNPGTGYTSAPTVIFGTPSAGGFSNEVDFGNLNLSTTVHVDVNGFLGNDPTTEVPDNNPATGNSNFVNMSATIAAHEVGHTLGLEHMDAFGPVGFGIANPPGASGYMPVYTGLVGAFTTPNDVIASPASVGSTLQDAASGQAQLGVRDAITLAFIADGTTLNSPPMTATPKVKLTPGSTATMVNAAPVSLYTLDVPNPVTSGFDAGKTLDVEAVAINDTISASSGTSVPDYYTFTGQQGMVMSFQVMSASLTRFDGDSFDSVLTIYDKDGNVVATNDDQFEPSDSSIFDFTLPTTGTYTVEVAAFHTTDPSFNDPTSKNYFPDAFNNKEQGDFELFMYSVATFNANPAPDSVYSAAPVVQIVGPPATDTNTSPMFSYTVTNADPGNTPVGPGRCRRSNAHVDQERLRHAERPGPRPAHVHGGGFRHQRQHAGLLLLYLDDHVDDDDADAGADRHRGRERLTREYRASRLRGSRSRSSPRSPRFKHHEQRRGARSISTTGPNMIGSGTLAVVNGADVATFTPSGHLSATTHIITATYLSDANDQMSTTQPGLTLIVAPKNLTVTAVSKSMTYGGTVPALTYTYSGLVNNDTTASFSGALSTSATSSSPVGGYGITQGSLWRRPGNYSIEQRVQYRDPDGDPGVADRDGRQQIDDVRRDGARAVVHIQRSGQQRHHRQFQRRVDDERHVVEPRGRLRDFSRDAGGDGQLHDWDVQHVHADGDPGVADCDGRQQIDDVRRDGARAVVHLQRSGQQRHQPPVSAAG